MTDKSDKTKQKRTQLPLALLEFDEALADILKVKQPKGKKVRAPGKKGKAKNED